MVPLTAAAKRTVLGLQYSLKTCDYDRTSRHESLARASAFNFAIVALQLASASTYEEISSFYGPKGKKCGRFSLAVGHQ